MADNIWKVRNMPPTHPARQKIVQYATENGMHVATVLNILAKKLK